MTEEERKTIEEMIDKAITEFALKLPTVISRLVMDASGKVKMWQEFLKRNNYIRTPHAELIGKIVMDVESDNPGKPYDYILREAEPIIRDRLKLLANHNFDVPEKKPEDTKFKGDLGTL